MGLQHQVVTLDEVGDARSELACLCICANKKEEIYYTVVAIVRATLLIQGDNST
jgi:hypothetical protein